LSLPRCLYGLNRLQAPGWPSFVAIRKTSVHSSLLFIQSCWTASTNSNIHWASFSRSLKKRKLPPLQLLFQQKEELLSRRKAASALLTGTGCHGRRSIRCSRNSDCPLGIRQSSRLLSGRKRIEGDSNGKVLDIGRVKSNAWTHS
jgi:hypothetical protein